jgi:hypothetical protein
MTLNTLCPKIIHHLLAVLVMARSSIDIKDAAQTATNGQKKIISAHMHKICKSSVKFNRDKQTQFKVSITSTTITFGAKIMNSAKIFATIVTAIALFPSASWADNVSGNNQEANLNTTIIGNGNTSVIETQQKSIGRQKSGFFGTNVAGGNQGINATTTIVGDGNVDIKKAVQAIVNGQRTK